MTTTCVLPTLAISLLDVLTPLFLALPAMLALLTPAHLPPVAITPRSLAMTTTLALLILATPCLVVPTFP